MNKKLLFGISEIVSNTEELMDSVFSILQNEISQINDFKSSIINSPPDWKLEIKCNNFTLYIEGAIYCLNPGRWSLEITKGDTLSPIPNEILSIFEPLMEKIVHNKANEYFWTKSGKQFHQYVTGNA